MRYESDDFRSLVREIVREEMATKASVSPRAIAENIVVPASVSAEHRYLIVAGDDGDGRPVYFVTEEEFEHMRVRDAAGFKPYDNPFNKNMPDSWEDLGIDLNVDEWTAFDLRANVSPEDDVMSDAFVPGSSLDLDRDSPIPRGTKRPKPYDTTVDWGRLKR